MPIIEQTGDLFTSGADLLVNPVNCEGVMGAGLALQFKKRYPTMFRFYRDMCRRGEMRPGSLHIYALADDPLIVSVATKRHWRDPSKLSDVYRGIYGLRALLLRYPIVESVALPALGCGLGGLDWQQVQPLIQSMLGDLDCTIYLYPPQGA